jgi:hypothetical protein
MIKILWTAVGNNFVSLTFWRKSCCPICFIIQ